MTTSAPRIDPALARIALGLHRQGKSVMQIAEETGLLVKEVRYVLDNARPIAAAAASQRPAAVPGASPVPAPPRPVAQVDAVSALIAEAESSALPKVRTADKRAAAAIANLKDLLAATEQERLEAEAAAEKRRAAETALTVARAQLEEAEKQFREAGGVKRGRPPRTPEQLEVLRANAAKAREAMAAKRREQSA